MSASDTKPLPSSAIPTSKGVKQFFVVLLLAVVVVAVATFIWGPVALTMAALPLVFLMFVFFIWISLP